MINVAPCACAELWNFHVSLAQNYEKCLNFLTNVIKQLFITFSCLLGKDSTFISARNL